MPRPKTKEELLSQSAKNYQTLMDHIEAMPGAEQEKDFPQGTLNRNIRDVLYHLDAWNLMLLEWYAVGMTGEKPDMPAKGFTWKTLPDLNKEIWKKGQAFDLKTAKKKLKASFKKARKLIEKHSDKELFEKKKYKWTGSTSMGAYLISATSSHYDWALKLIKKAKKK